MKTSLAVFLGLCVSLNPIDLKAQTLPDVCTCASGDVLVCSAANPGGCDLTVVVRQSPGGCTAEQFGKNSQGLPVQYCLVCVRRDPQGSAQDAPMVTWTLSPSHRTALFNTNGGISIDALSDTKAQFIDKSHSDLRQKYGWKATLKNSSAAHPVRALVFGEDSAICASNTAKIVNTDK